MQTQSFPPSAAEQILNEQRLKRPSSPHFTIYQPQLTWISSIANRVTGAGLSSCALSACARSPSHVPTLKPLASPLAVLYAFSIAYLVAPETFASANIIDLVAGLPEVLKYAGKTILAAPFAYHFLNGLRHLAWDMGKGKYSWKIGHKYFDSQ